MASHAEWNDFRQTRREKEPVGEDVRGDSGYASHGETSHEGGA